MVAEIILKKEIWKVGDKLRGFGSYYLQNWISYSSPQKMGTMRWFQQKQRKKQQTKDPKPSKEGYLLPLSCQHHQRILK
ncbi:hypothetical protein DSO57_1026668 [Entomophthora muscae]|uniref:Uncharacterized protein n=1 Tax=Entomophthora muscae TaxID=34485 RepID=A0ACC2RSW9_9FUNG|nr:hypothetical protein DSO57_1026668 [Entomophthora muscae]